MTPAAGTATFCNCFFNFLLTLLLVASCSYKIAVSLNVDVFLEVVVVGLVFSVAKQKLF